MPAAPWRLARHCTHGRAKKGHAPGGFNRFSCTTHRENRTAFWPDGVLADHRARASGNSAQSTARDSKSLNRGSASGTLSRWICLRRSPSSCCSSPVGSIDSSRRRVGPGSFTPSTGSPGAVTRPRLPQIVACGFPALRSSEGTSQRRESAVIRSSPVSMVGDSSLCIEGQSSR